MKQITQLGATVEEAISIALQQLNTTREQVEVEVLQEAKKGFLGFGARQAKVRVAVKEEEEKLSNEIEDEQPDVSIPVQEVPVLPKEEAIIETTMQNPDEEAGTAVEKEDPIESARDYLNSIAKEMGIDDLTIETEKQGKNLLFKMQSEKAALLIGKRGATLNSLQQLTQLIVNKNAKSFLMVKLDVEDYRERRQAALELLAERMAEKAVYTGRKVALEPMPSYERKIIHNALSNRVDIETYSEGTEPHRHLVIEPVR
ncbi:protein jag [Lysinibacillus yapensis]|uniref:RNA-binding protein KhpB n=1 Tax=Ureibacillus yapensis TaxID=2304605 RepID=A0A396SDQ2_9BACL|nr:RNA-binding cell elongation regulator Jag/EloR [Lysinibacillus yapensis]RHW36106.1 protein jag [Lysinibacillus yapensis]